MLATLAAGLGLFMFSTEPGKLALRQANKADFKNTTQMIEFLVITVKERWQRQRAAKELQRLKAEFKNELKKIAPERAGTEATLKDLLAQDAELKFLRQPLHIYPNRPPK